MSWPTAEEYERAVQNLRYTAGDEELQAGQPATDDQGLPLVWSGRFADVYQIRCRGKTVALKCFKGEVPQRQARYREIATHLRRVRLPFMVDFQYLEQGIRVEGRWFPVVKMQWVEGLSLTQFVEEHLQRPPNLRMLLDLWVRLAVRLRDARLAHADLQHDNVLLVPQPRGRIALRLIDYDGMWVPSLVGIHSGELGHNAYQHPQRFRENIYSFEVDRFSHLVIYTAVRALAAGHHDLWRRQDINNAENLLFRQADFEAPETSKVFRVLCESPDAGVRAMAGRLALACRRALHEAPLLDEVVRDEHVVPLSRSEEDAVGALFGAHAASPLPAHIVPVRAAVPAPARVAPIRQPPFASPELTETNSIGMTLVLIPAGEFMMGSPESDSEANSDEKPQHRVRITKPFYLAATEVTQEQYEQVMGTNPSAFQGDPKRPVEWVSWDDAVEFCRRLGLNEGKEYRLPTEAEWEYACRAGSTTRWSFGDDASKLGDYAWYDGNSGGRTHPVGQKKPNAWGLYDMHGSVWEWCADWYAYGYYSQSPADDPKGPSSGAFRVLRGGSLYLDPWFTRSAYRYWILDIRDRRDLGFRVARTL